jgi:EmrB/QacA subfamily drug resistance transporter
VARVVVGAAIAPTEAAAVTPLQSRVLTATIVGPGMAFADGSIVTVAIPKMRVALDASLAEMQWVANGYTLVLSALLLLGGAAGDRYGLRRVYALGIALFAMASFACALSADSTELILARAAQGFGAALMVPGSLALIAAHFPSDERGRAIGVWAATTSIAAAFGPLLGGWLIDHAPWQSIFLINLPFAALGLGIVIRGVTDLPAGNATGMDWLGALLAVIGLGGVALSLTLVGEPGADARRAAIASGAAGLAALAGFVAWESRARAPMMPLRFFRDRRANGVNILTLLLYFALSGAIFFLPSTLIQRDGWSAATAGSIFLGFTAMLAILSRFGGAIADRFGVRIPLTVGPAITAASFAALAPAVVVGDFWTAIEPTMLLMGVGMGITVAPLSTAVMASAPAGQTGVASAINNAVARVAGLFAVASLGAIVGDRFGGFSALALICAAAAAASAAVGFATLGNAQSE